MSQYIVAAYKYLYREEGGGNEWVISNTFKVFILSEHDAVSRLTAIG